MVGYYHSIDTMGTVDGQGIRYLVFLAGCNLGCLFCHNPDTWKLGTKTITVEEIIADFNRYRPFYEASNGGITVSGGEPLLQADFVAELFAAAKLQGISTTLDTSGFAKIADIDKVLPYTDHIMFGLKGVTKTSYQRLTNADGERIIENLRYMATKHELTIRYLVVPTINDSVEEIAEFIALIQSLPNKHIVDLLGYHEMGVYKWEALGLEYKLREIRPANKEDINKIKKMLKKEHIMVL